MYMYIYIYIHIYISRGLVPAHDTSAARPLPCNAHRVGSGFTRVLCCSCCVCDLFLFT